MLQPVGESQKCDDLEPRVSPAPEVVMSVVSHSKSCEDCFGQRHVTSFREE